MALIVDENTNNLVDENGNQIFDGFKDFVFSVGATSTIDSRFVADRPLTSIDVSASSTINVSAGVDRKLGFEVGPGGVLLDENGDFLADENGNRIAFNIKVGSEINYGKLPIDRVAVFSVDGQSTVNVAVDVNRPLKIESSSDSTIKVRDLFVYRNVGGLSNLTYTDIRRR